MLKLCAQVCRTFRERKADAPKGAFYARVALTCQMQAMEVVLNNTDGVTMAKLARTAKLGLTPVHHIRIQKDEDYGVK